MLFVNVKQTIRKHLDGNAGKLYVIEFSQNKKPIFSPCDLWPLHWDCHVCRMKDDCQVYYKIGFQIFYFMLYADFGGPEHANLLNNRKLQKHQIHCNLLCFDFHKCPIFRPKCTPWLKPSTSLQPFFFFSLRDLTVLHPKTFDSQSFIRPISLSVGKGQRPGFSEGLFIGSEQQTGCK